MLELRNIDAHYAAIQALAGLNIEVNAGELVALVGANGAGKTTTMSTIAGVVRPSAGDIQLEGSSLLGLTPEKVVRRGVAMVPEDRDIFPVLTVEQNLRLGAYTRHNRREYQEDLEKVCDRFRIIRERLNQSAGTLSGGEQQQLAIARALMSHPRVLLLDEPSLGLAPALVDEVFDLIQELHDQGTTILLVEQNVRKAFEIAQRVYLLHMGEITARGTPEELSREVDMGSVFLGGDTTTRQESTGE
jgi:branched-chain amino acid transport system ATP-binding protein